MIIEQPLIEEKAIENKKNPDSLFWVESELEVPDHAKPKGNQPGVDRLCSGKIKANWLTDEEEIKIRGERGLKSWEKIRVNGLLAEVMYVGEGKETGISITDKKGKSEIRDMSSRGNIKLYLDSKEVNPEKLKRIAILANRFFALTEIAHDSGPEPEMGLDNLRAILERSAVGAAAQTRALVEQGEQDKIAQGLNEVCNLLKNAAKKLAELNPVVIEESNDVFDELNALGVVIMEADYVNGRRYITYDIRNNPDRSFSAAMG